jgi:hypothetical protein
MSDLFKATSPFLVLLLGCAPGATRAPEPAAAAGGPVLAYQATASPFSYSAADTGAVSMEIPGMGPLTVNAGLTATAEISMERVDGALRAHVRLTGISGYTQNPTTGTVTVDDRGLPSDPAILTLTPGGRVTAEQLPQIGRALQQVTGASSLVRSFFVSLPGGMARPGATWVDTVTVHDDLGALTTTVRSVIRSTYRGDTIVSGRTFAAIDAALELSVLVRGDAGGAAIEQRLEGTGRDRILWDAARQVLVAREQEVGTIGWMAIAGTGMNDIPVTQQGRLVVRLRDDLR